LTRRTAVTTNPDDERSPAAEATPRLSSEEIEAMFPADPDIMTACEGDFRGLRKVQAKARARRDELDRKYPGLRVS
jgi:hypothetical protein